MLLGRHQVGMYDFRIFVDQTFLTEHCQRWLG
jgi:hypothetical protein